MNDARPSVPPSARPLWDTGAWLVSRWIFNCYVLTDEATGAAVVVDPGLPRNARDALGVVKSLDFSPRITTVAATHAHTDHVSGVPWLARELARESAGAGVWLPARVKRYLEGETPRAPGLRQLLRIVPVLRAQRIDWGAVRELVSVTGTAGYGGAGPFRFPIEPAGFLENDSELPGIPGWRVLSVPGHTDDSTALYHAASRTLVSGDAVLSYEGRAWFNPELVDLARSRETEERLRALEVEVLLPGHGPPLRGKGLTRHARSCR